MRWVLNSLKSSSVLAFALGLACPSVGLAGAWLVMLLSASGIGQVGYETFVTKAQIAVIELHLGLH